MAGFERFESALRGRDVLERLIRNVINRERPRPRYGEVLEISRTHSRCLVRLNGDTTSVLIPMGAIQPLVVGQIVRVEGVGTDRYITDVIGGAARLEENLPVVKLFTANGIWTKPAGLKYVVVRVQGGGGGGGGRNGGSGMQSVGAGGGGGGYAESVINAEELAPTVEVIVGKGGDGGTQADGSTGGQSRFSGPSGGVYANGGFGGQCRTEPNTTQYSATPGSGGLGAVNYGTGFTLQGGTAQHGFHAASTIGTTAVAAGSGGGSFMAPVRHAAPIGATGLSYPGVFPGGGGTGIAGPATTGSGGNGADGVVIVEEHY